MDSTPGRQLRRGFLRSLGFGAGALVAPAWLKAADSQRRPNIIVMMADDMGFSDIGCYGGEIRTPNLDRLAAGGVRFTQFYNTARCCPTRASLLTGLYPHQAGVGHMVGDKGHDSYRGDLNRRCVTIAEALGSAGYHTYMSGKWHVTKSTGPSGPRDNWPRQRGFDRYYGTLVGAGSFWTPDALLRDNRRLKAYPPDFYYTDAISDGAAQFIRQHEQTAAGDPFFLYVAYTSPHWPLHAPKQDVDRYRGRYMDGWDALREERHARMIDMGIVDAEWPLTPRDSAATAWAQVPEEKRREMDWRMAVYAAQIDRMDQGVGRIVSSLEQTGQLEDTLVLFLADNGGCAEGGPWGFERKKGGTLGENTSFASYGLSWANASNTPFRLYKHWVHEGGISSPLIAHWPRGIRAKGELRGQPGHVIDIMATCVAVSGATYPGEPITPLEGKSLVPAFADQLIGREAIYWEHEGNRAVRRGKWKLVSRHPGNWELYDLEADRTELNDLAAKQAEIVADMSAMYEAWAARCGVQPWPVRANVGSSNTEFDLRAGTVLAQVESPRVARRAFAVEATVTPRGPQGVIVAQGGSRVGWALYVVGGHVAAAFRRTGDDGLTVVESPDPLPDGEVTLGARIARNGDITLSVNGEQVAEASSHGSLDDMPTEGLEVGTDDNGLVWELGERTVFEGEIESVSIRLRD